MSALDQKQTFAIHQRVIALHVPRFVAQLPAQDLANVSLRQFGPELHQLRYLIGRELRLAVGDQVGFGEVWVLPDDEQLHRVAGARIWDANHRAFEHPKVTRHHRLDLAWIDLETGHRDHVLLAIHDPGPAGFVHDANIAGAEKTIGSHNIGGLIRTLPVAGHDLRSARTDFARFAELHLVVVIVTDRDFRRWDRQSDGASPFGRKRRTAGQHRRRLR